MKNERNLEKEKLNFDVLIKEKGIDSESQIQKTLKEKKSLILFSMAIAFLIIASIVIITSIIGYTS